MSEHKISRRQLLKGLGLAAAGTALDGGGALAVADAAVVAAGVVPGGLLFE